MPLTKRIIPCLDVKDGVVVKGVQFRNHVVLGEIVDLCRRYRDQGADELVFYDITASAEGRVVDTAWVAKAAAFLDIPFCVAGGIASVDDARQILRMGADKVSINTPALNRPELISELARTFGSQCVVVGIDSRREGDGFVTWRYTGSETTARADGRETLAWICEAVQRGAGEIVLNCMRQDGTYEGYDVDQLAKARAVCSVPLIASGGAGSAEHFVEVFRRARVDGALAASIFHRGEWTVPEIKRTLAARGIEVRL